MATHVEQLHALLERCDVALITCAEREVAALSREKRQILGELAALDAVEDGRIDDLAQRRKKRRAEAAARAAT